MSHVPIKELIAEAHALANECRIVAEKNRDQTRAEILRLTLDPDAMSGRLQALADHISSLLNDYPEANA
jgi:hypothetical protein